MKKVLVLLCVGVMGVACLGIALIPRLFQSSPPEDPAVQHARTAAELAQIARDQESAERWGTFFFIAAVLLFVAILVGVAVFFYVVVRRANTGVFVADIEARKLDYNEQGNPQHIYEGDPKRGRGNVIGAPLGNAIALPPQHLTLTNNAPRMTAAELRAAATPELTASPATWPKSPLVTELLKQRPQDGQLVTPLGVTIEGTPLFAPLDQSRTALVIGVPGTGKTTFIDAVLGGLLIQDLAAAGGDPSRYGQLVRLALIETDPVGLLKFDNLPQTWGKLAESNGEAEALVMSLDEEQRRRAMMFRAVYTETGQTCEKIADYNAYAANNGLETLPHIVLAFEEAPATLDTIIRTKAKIGDGGSLPLLLDNAARKWRKFGIWPWFLTQKPTTDAVGSTIRALAQSLICFRLAQQSQAVAIGVPEAAGLDDVPGRAAVNLGGQTTIVQGPFFPPEALAAFTRTLRFTAGMPPTAPYRVRETFPTGNISHAPQPPIHAQNERERFPQEIFPAEIAPDEAGIEADADEQPAEVKSRVDDPQDADWRMYVQIAWRGHDPTNTDVKFADTVLQNCGIGKTEKRTAIKQEMRESGWLEKRGEGAKGGYYLSQTAISWLKQQEGQE